MPRTYSDRFLIGMHQANPRRAGVALAKACVKANLPAKYVAVALGVSRMTIYSWFRGKPIRDKNQQLAEVFTELVEGDIVRGILPAKTMREAQKYIDDMLKETV